MNTEELIERVASHLTGVTVKVRFREPATAGAGGQVYQASGGVVLLDVHPELNLEEKWETLLHELAHVRLKHHLYTTTSHQAKPGSVQLNQAERERWNQSEPERQVEHLVETWKRWAEKRGNFYLNQNLSLSGVQALLYSLLEWKEG